jgi:hypothetical protein
MVMIMNNQHPISKVQKEMFIDEILRMKERKLQLRRGDPRGRPLCQICSGHRIEDHFADISKMIGIGKGGKRIVMIMNIQYPISNFS